MNRTGDRTYWFEVLRVLGSGPVFTICGNPSNFNLADGWLQLIFLFGLPTAMFLFFKKSRKVLERVALHQCWTITQISLNRKSSGKGQRVVKWLSNQVSSYRLGAHEVLLIYGQLTFMLHYRICGAIALRIFSLEVSLKYSFCLRVIKTRLFPTFEREH